LVNILVVEDYNTVATGDSQRTWVVPQKYNGLELYRVAATVSTPSTSGLPTIVVRDMALTQDITSTPITLSINEYDSYDAVTQPVINPSYKVLHTGQRIAFDVDIAGTGTKGLNVLLTIK